MQAAVASTSTIDANASWLARGPACATSATRRSASSLQVSAGWRARSTIKCTQSLKQSFSPSGLFGMEVESGRGIRRVQKRVSPLVRAQAAGPSPFSLSASLPILAWIPRAGRWLCIMIWFYFWNVWLEGIELKFSSFLFNFLFGLVIDLFASSVPMDWHITALVSTDGEATGELATTQSSTSGMVLPAVGIACLGAILFGYHLGYFYSAPNSCTQQQKNVKSLKPLKPDLFNEVAGNSPHLTVVVWW